MNRVWIWVLLPALLLAAIVAYLLLGQPLRDFTKASPPVEELSVEAVRLEPGKIMLDLRADGSAPVGLAQVQVDGAWRAFSLAPEGPIGRLGTARVNIPYSWVEGETVHLLLLTSTGVTFDHTVDVAQATPTLAPATLAGLTVIGLLLGLAPVAIGLLAYPAMRAAGPGALRFLLALTVGLLVFLMIDTLSEGLELGAETLGRLRGQTLVWVAMLLTAAVLLGLGRREGAPPTGAALATFIALGIGVHNFGEGLVVGTALVTGAAALAAFLVVGFVIHNVTEGLAIAVPLAANRPPLRVFLGLAALAGLPAVAGVWAGSQAVSPYWAALSFGVGAGAILQVVIELSAWLSRTSDGLPITRATTSGFALGLAIMYGTALFV
jgi:ZIP family zinc transporter